MAGGARERRNTTLSLTRCRHNPWCGSNCFAPSSTTTASQLCGTGDSGYDVAAFPTAKDFTNPEEASVCCDNPSSQESFGGRLRGSKEQGRTLPPRQSVSGIISQTSIGSFSLEWTNKFFIAQLRYPGAVQAKLNRCGWPKPHPEQKIRRTLAARRKRRR